jgi:hypothetical protein
MPLQAIDLLQVSQLPRVAEVLMRKGTYRAQNPVAAVNNMTTASAPVTQTHHPDSAKVR